MSEEDIPFHQERDGDGRRLISEFIADKDDTQVRTARKQKDAVFGQHLIGWRTLWAEAYRVKEAYGRHPSRLELLEFFANDAPDVPDDEVELRFQLTLQTLERKELLVVTVGRVDGTICQVLVNIKNPRNTEVDEDYTDGSDENQEEEKVNLDKI